MDDHAPRGCCLTAAPGMAEPQAIRAEIFPPRALDPDLVEIGRRLFSREARFIAGAAHASALPHDDLPEIAFAGRSNVGKSSLLNALTGRRALARISNTPGRTRQINFFDLDARLMLVDLPGYGYAEAPKVEIRRWTALLRRYLQTRTALRRVCLLIDSRHGIKDMDYPMMLMLDDVGVSYQIVLTKIDKLGAGELALTAERTRTEIVTHTAAHPEIHLTSALKRRGIAELRATLGSLATSPALPSTRGATNAATIEFTPQ
jgi:GTP-binding protein